MAAVVDEIEAGGASSEESVGAEEGAAYRSRLGGAVVRVCEKCMGRQRERGAEEAVAFLAEDLRWRSQGDARRTRLRVAEVGCMKICPEDGVAVSASGAMGRVQGLVVRTAADAEALHGQFRGEQAGGDAGSVELSGRALRRAQRLAVAQAEAAGVPES